MPIQVRFSDKPDDVVAVISNCGDVHKVSRLTYLKEMMESTPELKVQFFGSCSPNGRYPGDKAVWCALASCLVDWDSPLCVVLRS